MGKCETGCINFTGGEKRHHKDCFFYKDSFTEMYDNLESKLKAQQEVIDDAIEALDKISKDAVEVGFYVEPTWAAQVAREALAKLKQEGGK